MMLNSVSVDCVIFGFDKSGLQVLLNLIDKEALNHYLPIQTFPDTIKNDIGRHILESDNNLWSLFGGHIPDNQDLDEYAKDLLFMATGLKDVYLQQVCAFGFPRRVPYARVITIGYYALINPDHYTLQQSRYAKSLQWFKLNELPSLCLDHEQIIQQSLEKLRHEVMFHPIGFHLLPKKFTLTDIQQLYETILNKKMDTRNFRKKLAKMKLLLDSGEKQKNVAHRAAKLYQFDMDVYRKLKKEGLNFRIT